MSPKGISACKLKHIWGSFWLDWRRFSTQQRCSRLIPNVSIAFRILKDITRRTYFLPLTSISVPSQHIDYILSSAVDFSKYNSWCTAHTSWFLFQTVHTELCWELLKHKPCTTTHTYKVIPEIPTFSPKPQMSGSTFKRSCKFYVSEAEPNEGQKYL